MAANFTFRDINDNNDLSYYDLGGFVDGENPSPYRAILKNTGDRTASNSKIRILPDLIYQNISGSLISGISTLSSGTYQSGEFNLMYVGANTVVLNNLNTYSVTLDGSTPNYGIINGLSIQLASGQVSGTYSSISISNGFNYCEIAKDLNGSPESWENNELSVGYLFPGNGPTPSGTLLNEGGIEIGTINYLVSLVTSKGESMPSASFEVINSGPSGTASLAWENVLGVSSYNIYKSVSGSHGPSLLANVSGNTFNDDGDISVQINNNPKQTTESNIQKFWLKLTTPGNLNQNNSKKFKLRSLGVSS